MTSNKFVTAYMQGGLGNQLFIYFAALAQARRLNCSLCLDVSRYEDSGLNSASYTQRKLGILDFISKTPSSDLVSYGSQTRLQRAVKFFTGKIFVESRGRREEISERVKPGFRMVGYFQSPDFFEAIDEEVLQHWALLEPTSQESARLEALKPGTFIALHVRRGDYLDPAIQATHGLCSAEYFRKGLETLRKIEGNLPVVIFTDSPEYVSKELEDLDNSTIFDQHGIRDSIVIKVMASARAIAISNSSFSWWAGYLISKTSQGTVLAPRPWFADGSTPERLLLPDWLSLGS